MKKLVLGSVVCALITAANAWSFTATETNPCLNSSNWHEGYLNSATCGPIQGTAHSNNTIAYESEGDGNFTIGFSGEPNQEVVIQHAARSLPFVPRSSEACMQHQELWSNKHDGSGYRCAYQEENGTPYKLKDGAPLDCSMIDVNDSVGMSSDWQQYVIVKQSGRIISQCPAGPLGVDNMQLTFQACQICASKHMAPPQQPTNYNPPSSYSDGGGF